MPDAEIEFINVRQWDRKWRPSLQPGRFVPSVIKKTEYIKARSRFPTSRPALISTSRSEIADYINSQRYDLIVVGADVSLKPLPAVLGEQLPYYWIDTSIKTKKVMLASSADITKASQLSQGQILAMKEVLSDFCYIGIRDSMTFALVESLGYGERASRVPDPTFSYRLPEIRNARLERIKKESKKNLCGISLPPTPFNIELVRELEKRYTIVCLMVPWKNKLFMKDIGPFAWCSVFRYLDLVVTVSFHESIFGFKSGIPAFALDCNPKRVDIESNSSKTLSLMTDMGLPDHHINPRRDDDAANWGRRVFSCCDSFPSVQVGKTVEHYGSKYKQSVEQAIESAI